MTLAQLLLDMEDVGVWASFSRARVITSNDFLNGSLSTFSNEMLGTPGYMFNPDDHSITTTYFYDGETLASEGISTSILDGLKSSAIFDNQHPFDAFYAISSTRKVVFGIMTTGSEIMPLSYPYVRKIFRLIAMEIVVVDEYAKVEFQSDYDGEKIRAGFCDACAGLG